MVLLKSSSSNTLLAARVRNRGRSSLPFVLSSSGQRSTDRSSLIMRRALESLPESVTQRQKAPQSSKELTLLRVLSASSAVPLKASRYREAQGSVAPYRLALAFQRVGHRRNP